MYKLYFIDTNIILDGIQNLYKLSDNKTNPIFITETVVKEIDKFKNGYDTINFEARNFNRLIANSTITSHNFYTVIENDDILLYIIHENSPELCNIKKNDDKIIHTFFEYILNNYNSFNSYIILSNDTIFRLSANILKPKKDNIEIKTFFKDENLIKSKKDSEDNLFCEEYIIDDILPNQEIYTIDFLNKYIKENKIMNISNKVSYIKIIDAKNKPFYLYRENPLQFIKIDKGAKTYFGLKAKNLKQKIFLEMILNDRVDCICTNSPSGSGKNFISTIGAFELIRKKKYQNIIYIRKTIIAGDKHSEIGFLPGSLSDKIANYTYPMKDNIALIIRNKHKSKNLTNEELQKEILEYESKFNISYLYTGHIRGRTLPPNSIIILDEFQNFSLSDIKTLISRIGEKSKLLCIGSTGQIDDPYLIKGNTGLDFMMAKTGETDPFIQGIILNKVERSRLAEWIENSID